jgi:flagellar motor switch/type III secretory pathway protein FliN
MNALQEHDPWKAVANLGASLAMELDVPAFTVAELMRLGPGSVLTTRWPTNRDVPLRINGRLLAWAEFETTGNNVGVRVTEFAWEPPQVLP